MNDFHVIIPARYASSRLPGKPLLDIAGKPMIQHVVESANKSQAKSVTVATDDERIQQAVQGFGGNAVMTSADHVSGSDRIAEASGAIQLGAADVIVNVQGDEPLLPPALIDQVAALLCEHPLASISTLCVPLESQQQLMNPNIVKVVRSEAGEGMYFSRAPIPWCRSGVGAELDSEAFRSGYRHLGIYAYTSGYIQDFTNRSPAPLELLEQLEQLRAIWFGDKIACGLAQVVPPAGVDDAEDLQNVRQLMVQSS